jgi:quercetin dioxygenase-like cupin family protein
MEPKKCIVIHASEVKPLLLDECYVSRMLLSDEVTGEPTVHINQGTLKGGCSLPGSSHTAAEIYFVLKGEATLNCDGQEQHLSPGSLVYIPEGVHHALSNNQADEEFVLLTIWKSTTGNLLYEQRLREWGKAFKTIYED